VLNVAAGHYFLDEKVTSARWIGSAIIMLGVVFVSRSGDRTVEANGERQMVAARSSE